MIAPKYDLYLVRGGYLGDQCIVTQEPKGQSPEIEPGQTAEKVTRSYQSGLTVERMTNLFDDLAEGDNYYHLIGVAGTFAEAVEEAEGKSIAQYVLYQLAIRYAGIQDMGR